MTENVVRPVCTGLAPDTDDVSEALFFGAVMNMDLEVAEHIAAWDEGVGPAGKPDEFLVGPGLFVRADVEVAVANIRRIYSRPVLDLAEVAGGVAAAVASVRVLVAPPLNRKISADAGYLAAGSALERMGFTLVADQSDTMRILLEQAPLASLRLVAEVRKVIVDAVPTPRVVLLTPLANVGTDEQHRAIVRVSDGVREALEPEGFVVDCPGDRLHPDTSHDWSPARMFDAERRRILAGGMVAIATADVPSFGLGQSQSWAENNIAVVKVYADTTSRTLGSGNQFGTEIDPWTSVDETVADIVSAAKANKQRLVDHAQGRIAIRQAWTKVVLSLPERDRPAATRLFGRRQDKIVSDPIEAASASLTEMRQLRTMNPDIADRIADVIMGRPITTNVSYNGLPRAVRAVIDRTGADETERDLVAEMVAKRDTGLLTRRTSLSQAEAARCLAFLRGQI